MDESLEHSFVQEMQDALQEQLSESELATRTKQHDAAVVANEGAKTWRELNDAVQSDVKAINAALARPLLSFSKDARGNLFILKHELTGHVTQIIFDPTSAAISYKGQIGEGAFYPRIEGNGLKYGWNDTVPWNGVKPSRLIKLEGDEPPVAVPTKQMSEIVVRCVVMEPVSKP